MSPTGDSDIAIFRPTEGRWFNHSASVIWGAADDIPVPADYDGDGAAAIAVYRPSIGVWFVEGGVTVTWGAAEDIPLPLPDAIRRFFFAPL